MARRKNQPLSTDTFMAIGDSLESLYAAFGAVTDHEDKALKTFATIVFDALDEFENAFCRADWRAYREWANTFKFHNGVAMDPCDAWWEIKTDGKWIDDDYEVPLSQPAPERPLHVYLSQDAREVLRQKDGQG